nr:gamma-glutamylcyclotransferase family protein [uncultured Holophaga sp.]
MEPDGLFIYGTLREGGRHRIWLDRTHPEGSTLAHAPGRLFHLPEAGYPAMVAGPAPQTLPPAPGWVSGEFVGYGDEAALEQALTDLDALEDVEGGLFERRVLPVLLSSGQVYAAWIYLFPEDRIPTLERQAIELPEGDWGSYLGD